jgi:hypothetical protein
MVATETVHLEEKGRIIPRLGIEIWGADLVPPGKPTPRLSRARTPAVADPHVPFSLVPRHRSVRRFRAHNEDGQQPCT